MEHAALVGHPAQPLAQIPRDARRAIAGHAPELAAGQPGERRPVEQAAPLGRRGFPGRHDRRPDDPAPAVGQQQHDPRHPTPQPGP